jgi:predicted metal-dependent peptidase
MNDVNKKIEDSLIRISIKFPYFTRLITRLKYEELPSSQLPTMGVDSNEGIVYYNSEFVNSLTSDELDFVVMHEMLHIVHRHCSEREVKSRSHEENNISMDLEINSVIKEKILFGTPVKDGCYPSNYGLPELYTHEWYLERLPKLSKLSLAGLDITIRIGKSNGIGVQNRNSLNRSINEVIDKLGLDPNLSRKVEGNASGEFQGVGGSVTDEGKSGSKIAGRGSNITRSRPRKVVKHYTFKDLLKKVAKDKILNNTDYTYSKMSRRGQDSQIIFPGKQGIEKNSYTLAIVFDVSGSMGNTINKIHQSLNEFYKKFKLTYKLDIDIYICDTYCLEPIPIKDFCNSNTSYYGGGTYLFTAYEKICKGKKEYKDIIIITDAYDDFSQFKKYNKRCFIALPKENKSSLNYITSVGNKNLIPVILED